MAMTFNRILVPYDGSPCAERALDMAIDMAERTGAELIVANIVPAPAYAVRAQLADQKFAKAIKNETLNNATQKLKEQNIGFKAILEYGDPAEMIMRIADMEKVDLIYMGCRGLSAFTEILLGSVSTKIIHLTKCPVTLVK